MSASTDNDSPPGAARRAGAPAAAWRPVGGIYLLVLLAATAAGMWPEAIYPTRDDLPAAPLPVLPAVALGQVAFVLLIYPLVALVRAARPRPGRLWPDAPIEAAGLMIAAAPFYLVAAWLADAVAADVARVVVYTAGLWTVAISAAALLRRFPPARPAILVALLLVAAGLPAAWYIAVEFVTTFEGAEWLWQLAPATFAWDAARARAGSWLPRPLWAMLVWPGVAAASACALLLAERSAR